MIILKSLGIPSLIKLIANSEKRSLLIIFPLMIVFKSMINCIIDSLCFEGHEKYHIDMIILMGNFRFNQFVANLEKRSLLINFYIMIIIKV